MSHDGWDFDNCSRHFVTLDQSVTIYGCAYDTVPTGQITKAWLFLV